MAAQKAQRWLVLADAVVYATKWYRKGEEFLATPRKVDWLAKNNKITLIQGDD